MSQRKYFNAALCAPETRFETLERLLNDPQWDPNSNINGVNGIHVALEFPIPEAIRRIELFLNHGADVNCVDKQYHHTPLFKLVAAGINEKTIQFLKIVQRLKIKLDYNLRSASKTTPLIMAAKTRNEMIALQLLEFAGHEVDIHAEDNIKDTAFHYACMLGMTSLAIALLQWGANLFQKNAAELTAIEMLTMPVENIERLLKNEYINPERDEYAQANMPVDHNGLSLVFIHRRTATASYSDAMVAKKENKAAFAALFKENLVVNSNNFTEIKVREGQLPAYKTLKDQLGEAQKQALLTQFDEMSGMSLLQACNRGHGFIRWYLMRENYVHPWLLWDAVQNNEETLVIYLLRNKAMRAYINDPNPMHGRTALHTAAELGNVTICNLLLAAGANPLLGDTNDLTPLHLAIIFKKKETFVLLANRLADTYEVAQWREMYRFIRLRGVPTFAHELSRCLAAKSSSSEKEIVVSLQISQSLFKLGRKLLGETGTGPGCKPIQQVPINRRKPLA